MSRWIPPCESCCGDAVCRCPTCRGKKKITCDGEERKCPECKGVGWVITHCMYCDTPGKWQRFYLVPLDTPDSEMGRYNGDWNIR